MKRLLFLAILFSALHAEETPSENQNIVNLEGLPSSTVGGCVNVISGDFTITRTDLSMVGPEPLSLVRCYTSSQCWRGTFGYGWHHNLYEHIDWADCNRVHKGSFGTKTNYYVDRNGPKNHYKYYYTYRPYTDVFESGVTNASSGVISGQTNLINTYLEQHDNEILKRTGSGTVSKFRRIGNSDNYEIESVTSTHHTQTRYQYFCTKILSVDTANALGNVFSRIVFKIDKDTEVPLNITGTDLREVSYSYDGKSKDRYLTNANSSFLVPEIYHYEKTLFRNGSQNRRITRVSRPEDRFLKIGYIDAGDTQHFACGNKRPKGESNAYGRVKWLQAPVGKTKTPVTTYRFVYDVDFAEHNQGAGITHVYDAYNSRKTYSYNRCHRLKSIEHFTGTNDFKLHSVERFYWGNRDYKDESMLYSNVFQDASGNTLACKTYRYDERGNVLQECLFGNITGKFQGPVKLNPQGQPIGEGHECEQKFYEYSNDGMNLLLREINCRNEVLCSYYPNTSLLKSKFILDEHKVIRIRQFFFYNENGTLIRDVTDDGNGKEYDDLTAVTERRSIVYTPRTVIPIGLPQIIEEYVLDLSTQQETLLKRTINTHNTYGNLLKREVYGSDGKFAFDESWEYESHGLPVSQTDANGNRTTMAYDANLNMIRKCQEHIGYTEYFTYDFVNRLIARELAGHKCTYSYDYMGQVTEETNAYGNTTYRTYNELGQSTSIRKPLVYDLDNAPQTDNTLFSYDVMGYVSSTQTAHSTETVNVRTLRGKPVHVVHSDGTTESYEYNTDGTIAHYTAKNGCRTTYTYDFLSRQTSATTYSPSGEQLRHIRKQYNAFHLTHDYDPNGNATIYTYDHAGRPLTKTKGNQTTRYAYDHLGRECQVITGDLVLEKEYDALSNVICETKKNLAGEILSEVYKQYDAKNRLISTTVYRDHTPCTTRTEYDALDNIIRVTDPDGNVTQTHYVYDYYNSHGQCVPYCEVTDPKGLKRTIISDAKGRETELLTHNTLGLLLQRSQFSYDSRDKKTARRDTFYIAGKEHGSTTTRWEYDSDGRCIKVTEAEGSEDQRALITHYNTLGLRSCITKADGVQIYYHYDELGRLQTLQSTDGTVHEHYIYDANDNIIQVIDYINHTQSIRAYDENNLLTQETLSNGLTLRYTYDSQGRIQTFVLPDNSSIAYQYNGCNLTKVQRYRDAHLAYEHTYLSYNLTGQCLLQQRAYSAGIFSTTYNHLGRIQSLECPSWSETNLTYDALGNLLSTNYDGEQRYYDYDELNQLTRESGLIAHTYQFDSLHNLRQKDDQTTTVNNHHQILSLGDQQLQYDPNGNLIAKDDLQLKYDALNRLIQVITPTASYAYQYDDLNRRVRKTAHCGSDLMFIENYIYEGQNEIGACNSSGQITQLRVLGIGLAAEIGSAIALEFEDQVYIPQHDHNGNIIALLDSSGTLVEAYRYSTFGEEEQHPSINPWRFSSKRLDEETSFFNFGRRYYDPQLGRWISKDPIGDKDGPNRYAYLHNNPLMSIDAYGLWDMGMGVSVDSDMNCSCGLIGSLLTTAISMIGCGVESLAYHCIPFPMTRYVLEGVGLGLQGKNPFHEPTYYRPVEMGSVGEIKRANMAVCYVPGIMTTVEEAKATAEIISDRLKGTEVDYICDPSCGFVLDGMDIIDAHLPFEHKAISAIADYIKDMVEEMRQNCDNPTLYMIAHSRGGLYLDCALAMLDPEIKKHVVAYTIGSLSGIATSGLKDAKNYVNKYDVVPKLNAANYLRSNINYSYTTYMTNMISGSVCDHFMSCDGYDKVLSNICYRITRKEGF